MKEIRNDFIHYFLLSTTDIFETLSKFKIKKETGTCQRHTLNE